MNSIAHRKRSSRKCPTILCNKPKRPPNPRYLHSKKAAERQIIAVGPNGGKQSLHPRASASTSALNSRASNGPSRRTHIYKNSLGRARKAYRPPPLGSLRWGKKKSIPKFGSRTPRWRFYRYGRCAFLALCSVLSVVIIYTARLLGGFLLFYTCEGIWVLGVPGFQGVLADTLPSGVFGLKRPRLG